MTPSLFGSNLWLRLCLFVIILQQMLVATGTYLMGKIAEDATHNQVFFTKVIAFGFCLALSGSLFHYLVCYFSARAQKHELRNYFNNYINGNYGNCSLWRETTAKSNIHDMMMRECPDTIMYALSFLVDSVATILNILFNTIAIMFITGFGMGLAILIAGASGLWVIHISSKQITKASELEMIEQNLLNGHLSESWDNIILGNRSFFTKWFSVFKRRFANTELATINKVNKSDAIIALSSFVTTGIVLTYLLAQIVLNSNNTVAIVGLLVMLPRSMQVVMHLQIIQSYWAQWKQLKQKINMAKMTLERKVPTDLNVFINYQEISINYGLQNLIPDDIQLMIQEQQVGRITIGGENGTGKSSLLMRIKSLAIEHSIYIPAQHHLEIFDEHEIKQTLSMGEKIIKTISCILKDEDKEKVKVILLDEWDAHLSSDNVILVNAIINKLAKESLIIEVRHQRSM